MKKNLIRLFVFFVVFAFIASSCNKENDEQAQNIPDNIATATVDEAVRLAKQKYLVAEVFEGDEHQSFFIPNEGLIDEYLAGEENTMPDAKMPSNTFIRCLSSLGLSDAQIPLVRRALLAHENRNEMLIERHRQELETILARAAGEISRPEFNRKIALLRTNLQNALLRLKETNADAFSRSYRMLMNHLHNILEPRQWNVFTDCLK